MNRLLAKDPKQLLNGILKIWEPVLTLASQNMTRDIIVCNENKGVDFYFREAYFIIIYGWHGNGD